MTPIEPLLPHVEALRNEHHVWFLNPQAFTDTALLDAARNLLSDHESERHSRLRFATDRHSYLISHALLRRVLSLYAPVKPHAWQFSRGHHGKPEIANRGVTDLHFNLTHTRNLAACIISLDVCGIDSEYLRDRTRLDAIAKRMFSVAESDCILQAEGRGKLELFYQAWTLREAYVKARGLGVSFPLEKLQFSPATAGRATIEFDTEINDTPDHWDFQLFRPTGEHLMATAIHSEQPVGKPVKLKAFSFGSSQARR